ncbi:sugar ABC transporter substrate-binding protein [Actinoallomurus sp. NPDC050550]|uniref:ABC transporter substrate-binding protein n=1 Tax=Actinoallomurus sp. NPDC050550 TaxID=3154937 RepID=UPI0033E1D7A0
MPAHGSRPTDRLPGAVSRRAFLRQTGGALAVAGTLGAASPLLAACGSGKSGNAKELTFWNFYSPNPVPDPQSKWFADLVNTWNKQNEVKIKLRFLPVADYTAGTQLQTAFSSGEGPDIFLISPGDFLRYYNGRVLEDLTPYLSQQAIADFLPGTLDTRKVGGKIYGLPMEVEPLAMFYSVPAFEKAGLSDADIPKTWDQLLTVAQKLTTKDQFGLLLETTPGYYQNFTWYPFMWMGGGSAVSTGQTSPFNAPGTVNALKLWQDAVKRGVAPRKVKGTGAADAPANLGSGYCAIQQTGIWSVAQLAQQKKQLEYGVFPLPTPPGGKAATDLGGWAFVANRKGKNPEAAAKFVAWALGSTDAPGVERVRQWNTVVKTNIPVRKSVREAADAHGAFAKGPLKTFVDDVRPSGHPEPRYTPEVYKAVSDALQACQLNGADPAKSAADAAQRIDTFLKRYNGAPIL